MKIERIEFENLTTYEAGAVDLPERGVVLVTGENGSGKSTIVEAIPWTLWGKSLRGSSLWGSGEGGAVRVTIDGTVYERRAAGRVKAGWLGGPSFETTREAQAALVERFGDRSDWTKSAVLSSYDASRFATATDAERKRLLEALTGSEYLEDGYRRSLEELRAARGGLSEASASVAAAEASVRGARKRVEDLVDLIGGGKPEPFEPVEPERLEALRRAESDASAEAEQRRGEILEARRREASAAERTLAAERERARLDVDNCPACSQPIPQAKRDALAETVREAEAEALEEEKRVQSEIQTVRADLAELEEERVDLLGKIRKMEAAQAKEAALASEIARLNRAVDLKREALKDLGTANTELEEARERVGEADKTARTVEAASRVLSTKGVRSHLLGRTISAIEAATNAWLGRICGERISVGIAPYSQTKSGGVKDAVALSVTVEGREGPYESASGGERRRIDVALCFALAQVAEAGRAGKSRSTMFCDEVFDALDPEGVSRVCEALEEIARDRCVVVISHSAAERIKEISAESYRVSDGKITRL